MVNFFKGTKDRASFFLSPRSGHHTKSRMIHFFQGKTKPTCSAKSAVAAVSLATRSNLSDDYLVTPTWGAKIGWVEAKGDC